MSEPQEPGESRDVVVRMRALGLRTDADALAAWLRDAHRQRLGPTQTVEQLIAMERRTREANNLAQRTRLAMIGTPKPLDRFDWQHPRAIDRVSRVNYFCRFTTTIPAGRGSPFAPPRRPHGGAVGDVDGGSRAEHDDSLPLLRVAGRGRGGGTGALGVGRCVRGG